MVRTLKVRIKNAGSRFPPAHLDFRARPIGPHKALDRQPARAETANAENGSHRILWVYESKGVQSIRRDQ